MPKPKDRQYPNNTFTFAIVEYHKYNPVRIACRYYRHVEGFGSLIRELPDWPSIFNELKDFHPGVKFDIPDEMPIVRYNAEGKEF